VTDSTQVDNNGNGSNGDPDRMKAVALHCLERCGGLGDATTLVRAQIDQSILHFRSAGWSDVCIGVMLGITNMNLAIMPGDPPEVISIKAMGILGGFLHTTGNQQPVELADLPEF